MLNTQLHCRCASVVTLYVKCMPQHTLREQLRTRCSELHAAAVAKRHTLHSAKQRCRKMMALGSGTGLLLCLCYGMTGPPVLPSAIAVGHNSSLALSDVIPAHHHANDAVAVPMSQLVHWASATAAPLVAHINIIPPAYHKPHRVIWAAVASAFINGVLITAVCCRLHI